MSDEDKTQETTDDTEKEDKNNIDTSDTVTDESTEETTETTDDDEDVIVDRSEESEDETDDDKEEITYEAFNLPEDREIDQDTLENFTAFAKKQGFSQEAAQNAIDFYVDLVGKQEQANMDRWVKLLDDKQAELKKDKDFGGKNFKETIKAANSVVREYDPDKEARKEMKQYGFGNFPGIVKMLARIAKATAEDKSPDNEASTSEDETKKSIGERMWPNLKP